MRGGRDYTSEAGRAAGRFGDESGRLPERLPELEFQPMGQITSLFVRKVVAKVDESVDKAELLRSVGLDPDGSAEVEKMVPAAEYYRFLESIAAVDPRATSLPLRVGESMRCDDYGAFGLAWKSATTLHGSFGRAERYARVLTNVSTYEVEPAHDRQNRGGAYMHLHRQGERRLGLRLSNEATLASVVSISRQVSTRDFSPLEVHLKHPAPGVVAEHEAYFGCPVYFDSDRDALFVSSEALATPNRLGDASISSFFDTHLEAKVAKLEDEGTLEKSVRTIISRALSEGVPTISEVAKDLAMSGRTLQRRLSGRGYSFQNLVDESRRQLAERLLEGTDFSLAEVAFMTGFSEQSAFTRAFKRWAGQTPRSYRLAAQG